MARAAMAIVAIGLACSALPAGLAGRARATDDKWLAWTAEDARARGRVRVTGRVGGFWGIRGLHTERAMRVLSSEGRVRLAVPESIASPATR